MIHSKKAISGFLLISGIFLGACKSEQVSNIPTITQPSANTPVKLEFEKTSVTKFSAASKSAKLEITIDYVQAKGEHPAAKKFNQLVMDTLKKRVLEYGMSEKKPDLANLSLDSCLALAQKNHKMLTDEMGESASNEWTIELSLSVAKNTEKLVCISLNAYNYTGGAHPNTYLEFLNYSPLTQQILSKSDIIADANGLKAVAEVAFRKHWASELKDLKPEQPLSDAGFEFKDRFDLPEQIGFQGDSLVLFYNTYEISAYVTGATDLYLPLSEVSKFLK